MVKLTFFSVHIAQPNICNPSFKALFDLLDILKIFSYNLNIVYTCLAFFVLKYFYFCDQPLIHPLSFVTLKKPVILIQLKIETDIRSVLQ